MNKKIKFIKKKLETITKKCRIGDGIEPKEALPVPIWEARFRTYQARGDAAESPLFRFLLLEPIY